MHFDRDDLHRSFDAATLARGRSYFAQLRVRELRVDSEHLESEVQGTWRLPYAVTVRIRNGEGGRILAGACSCPVGVNCKHAAATAIAALDRSSPKASKRDAADGAVDSWIESLATWQAPALRTNSREHVRYTVAVEERYYVPHFHLGAAMVPILKNGTFGTPRDYALHNLASGIAKQLGPEDRTIGRLIAASGLIGGIGNVSPTILGTLLAVLISTHRLHWRTTDSPTLHYEPIANARLEWNLSDDGRQRIALEGRPSTFLIGASPLWYVDAASAVAGPVESEIAPELSALLAIAPALSAEQAKRARITLGHIFSAVGVKGPSAVIDEPVVERDPTPLLRLSAYTPPPHAGYGATDSFATAELQFGYGEHVVAPSDPTQEFRIVDGLLVATWPRHHAFERAADAQLEELGFTHLGWPHTQHVDRERGLRWLASGEEQRWITFLSQTVPQLRKIGWRIDIDDIFPYTIVEAGEEWDAELSESESRWFELDLGIDIGGERVPLLPVLIEALATNGIRSADDLTALAARAEPIYGKLPNGAFVALPAARVARVLATLVDLFDGAGTLTSDGRLPMRPEQVAAVAALDGALHVQWTNAQSLRTLLTALENITERPLKLPSSFKAKLRTYQRDGVAWLQALRESDFGGVLADDMGLGKTVQLLAHVAIEKAAKRLVHPVLIVAPTSVVPNWRAEIARFTPTLRVLSLTGADRATRVDAVVNADLVLTTYALLPRDAEHLLAQRWSMAVLDEAQAIKNPRTKAAVVARDLHADQRIVLTGTPIENHLEELWSICAFAVPGLLGDRSRFARQFRTPIEKRDDVLRRNALAARIKPFLLRRTKENVAKELPPKTEIIQRIELAGAQRDLYETIRLAMNKRVRDEVARRGLARSRIVVLDALLKLRQVCCDPRLLHLPAAAGVKESQKLDALLEMLSSLIEDGRRILLFSQFTSMLDLIKPELASRGVAFVEIRGSTRDRETPVTRFQNREVPLFLISLKAGGTGLNLTAADTVIHYDPWWNPAVERQATDRAHRIGQEQHVFVYKLIAEGTVEERILELQERKGALAASLFDEVSTAPLKLELADIERLLG